MEEEGREDFQVFGNDSDAFPCDRCVFMKAEGVVTDRLHRSITAPHVPSHTSNQDMPTHKNVDSSHFQGRFKGVHSLSGDPNPNIKGPTCKKSRFLMSHSPFSHRDAATPPSFVHTELSSQTRRCCKHHVEFRL